MTSRVRRSVKRAELIHALYLVIALSVVVFNWYVLTKKGYKAPVRKYGLAVAINGVIAGLLAWGAICVRRAD